MLTAKVRCEQQLVLTAEVRVEQQQLVLTAKVRVEQQVELTDEVRLEQTAEVELKQRQVFTLFSSDVSHRSTLTCAFCLYD